MLKQDYLKGQLNDMNDFLQPVVHGFCFWFPMVEAGVLRSPGNKHCIVSHSPLKTGSLCWNASVLWFPKYYYYAVRPVVLNCLIDPVRSQLWSKPVIAILHQNRGNKMCTRNIIWIIQSCRAPAGVIRPRPYHQPDCYLEINCNKWVSSC